MPHVFISYSHKDVTHRDALIAELEKAGIENWYDDHIAGGRDWRDEIEVNLKEAFAVAVIVTRKSMCSTYVTYEWSWAIGNGTPIVPLLFEDIPYTKIHSRLSKIHHITCLDGIPTEALEILKTHQELSLDTHYLNRLIIKLVMQFRILARVSLWLYPYVQSHKVDYMVFKQLVEYTVDEASSLNFQKMPEFMVDKSHAFTTKQATIYRNLMKNILSFWHIFREEFAKSSLYRSIHPLEAAEEAEKYRSDHLEPLIQFFPTNSPNDLAYIDFDAHLRTVSGDKTALYSSAYPMSPSMVVEWNVTDPEKVNLIWNSIEAVRSSQFPKE